MRKEHVRFLVCPKCKSDLRISEAAIEAGPSIESGKLGCSHCSAQYPIVHHVPRFVPTDNYASSFGFQWNAHAKTQYDTCSGGHISEKRFFEETRWPRNLSGQIVLEVGSGSGRFTAQAISTKAMVISLDYSSAVDANYASNGEKDNVLIVQGDIYRMPFRENFFDKLFCFGVLQHTPDVAKAFSALPPLLKHGGELVVDVYRKRPVLKRLFQTKYWVRPLTRKMGPSRLYRIIDRYIEVMWPISRGINRLPFGRKINWALLIADYRGYLDLRDDTLKEWAKLDTFDMLSPSYDQPQTLDAVKGWFNEAALTDVDIHHGYNGIEGRGKKG